MKMMSFGNDGFGAPCDLFNDEVNLLVTSVYAATLAGIESLDRSALEGFKTAKWSHPDEKAQETMWWGEQVVLLRYHAGNMALVSLIMMFEHWLIEFEMGGKEIDVFPKDWAPHRLMGRFQRIEKTLVEKTHPKGPLSSERLQEAVNARNSIIHHASAAEYVNDYKKAIVVKKEFLSEIEIRGTQAEFRVGISESVLSRFSNEIRQQATLWFSQMCAICSRKGQD